MSKGENLSTYIKKEHPNLYTILKKSSTYAGVSFSEYVNKYLPRELVLRLKAKDPSLINEKDVEEFISRMEGSLEEVVKKTLNIDCSAKDQAKLIGGYFPDLPVAYIETILPKVMPRLNLGVVLMPIGSGIEEYNELFDPSVRAIIATHLTEQAEKLRKDHVAVRDLLLERIEKAYISRVQLARTPEAAKIILEYERRKL